MDVRVFTCCLCLTLVIGCIVDDKYSELTPADLVSRLEVIVYGEVIGFAQRDYLTDGTFRVYCVIKGDTRILENITIEAVSPRSACSGTYVYWVNVTSNFDKTGAVMILGLQETKTAGVYEFHEVNDLQSSAFDNSPESWKLIYSVVKSEIFPPINAAVDRCPGKSDPKGPAVGKQPVTGKQGENSGVRNRMDTIMTCTVVILTMVLLSRDPR
ncbi:uncharacterized protein LOC125653468 [Ostrea edulis]|uniref:uncharacterized protein LOC125653468 n=1 Tax=Ostrea edulis TaxID=37623 RepID=UPI0024AF9162|nr:uncharacterized protein LOC125653468 [Ostrea edulis]